MYVCAHAFRDAVMIMFDLRIQNSMQVMWVSGCVCVTVRVHMSACMIECSKRGQCACKQTCKLNVLCLSFLEKSERKVQIRGEIRHKKRTQPSAEIGECKCRFEGMCESRDKSRAETA
jgi:hypothetical protein